MQAATRSHRFSARRVKTGQLAAYAATGAFSTSYNEPISAGSVRQAE